MYSNKYMIRRTATTIILIMNEWLLWACTTRCLTSLPHICRPAITYICPLITSLSLVIAPNWADGRGGRRELIALFFAGQANNIVSAYYWWIIGDYRSECERLQFRLRARRSPFATITATALTALTLAARRNQFGNGQVKMQWLSSISH